MRTCLARLTSSLAAAAAAAFSLAFRGGCFSRGGGGLAGAKGRRGGAARRFCFLARLALVLDFAM